MSAYAAVIDFLRKTADEAEQLGFGNTAGLCRRAARDIEGASQAEFDASAPAAPAEEVSEEPAPEVTA